ncbi:MAG: rhodanese-like domain-containing protein [Aliifodinibius sp.]|nr:rhodanese-like domain-containing protein [Fodinibius sp.]NIV15412.1 rhodanese-like domain-containing protein [Fodinibius sp.]NIY29268.1 rhodanese-like domain-containing protein [Fodinibius sp.]
MIPPQKFKELLQEGPGVVIDVRTKSEYSSGHLKKTDHNYDISSSDFEENIEKLDKDKNYFLYCRTGARSGRAAQIMKRNGFENVYNIGGLQSLVNAGFEKE